MKRALGFMNKAPLVANFVSSWNTANTSAGSSTSTQVKLPLVSTGTYNFLVTWGDGNSDTITAWNAAATTHTYSTSGTYTVTISGVCTGWRFANTGDRLKILSIQSWGILNLGNLLGNYFYGCSNLTLTSVYDVLDLTGTLRLEGMFTSCSSLTTVNRMNEWNVSAVTTMDLMFQSATSFNQNIGSWNVGNVITISSMFQSATAFNQNIGSWNVSNVTTFAQMFWLATSFNQNIGSWNVSSANSFNFMFYGSGFDNGSSSSINNWILKSTGNITMIAMFRQCPFNQNIGSWNVSRVNTMEQMFRSNTAFNQNIGSWNVSAVTNLTNTFDGSSAFNQNIGSWNVSNVTTFIDFMIGKTSATFSTTNLDAIYNGWSSRAVLSGKTITFGSAKYTAASSAGRAILTGAPNNWVITDGGI